MFGVPKGQYPQYRHLILAKVLCIIWQVVQATMNRSAHTYKTHRITVKKYTLAKPVCNGVNTGLSPQNLWIAIRNGLTGTIGCKGSLVNIQAVVVCSTICC